MVIDELIAQIKRKKNPCIVGLDPQWEKLPACYHTANPADGLWQWCRDMVDAAADLVPAVKPQMAFFEVFGPDGLRVHQQLVRYAHGQGLLVVDDSKRGDIGSTAQAYAQAHLKSGGPIDADFLTVSPFLGRESMQPFTEAARQDGKGIFVLVRTSNRGSQEISGAITAEGSTVRDMLADYVRSEGEHCMGTMGYTGIGAVVGATCPAEAALLRERMPRSFFLVPGYGAQGGDARSVLPCFNPDGLGALVSASRSIAYHHLELGVEPDRAAYRAMVRSRVQAMQQDVYRTLKGAFGGMCY